MQPRSTAPNVARARAVATPSTRGARRPGQPRAGTRLRTVGLAALVALVAIGPAAASRQEDDLLALEDAFTEAWSQGRAAELEASRRAIAEYAEAHPGAARAHYLVGLTELSRVTLTNGGPDRSDLDATHAILDEAEARFERAYELDATQADACASLAFCILQRFMLGTADPERGPEMGDWLRKGHASGATRPSVRLMSTWLSTSQALQTPESTEGAMDQFATLTRDLVTAVRDAPAPDFWHLFGASMAARALLFSPSPRPGVAADAVDELLDLRPDFRMARAFLLPFVKERPALVAKAWSGLTWTELDGEPPGDGGAPGLPDAVAVSYCDDAASGQLWIRVHLWEPVPRGAFGVNLVCDTDGSPTNGSAWWGGNGDFRFDRLVSAWVARDAAGRYRGAVGVTDDRGAMAGEMTNLGDGTVGFGVDDAENAIVLRVPWSALGDRERLRFVVAVGTNAQWNDDLPDGGALVLPR